MFEVEQGVKKRAFIGIIYGPPGVGKSHLASQCGKTLFADLEDGTAFLDINRVKIPDYQKTLEFMGWAATQPQWETIVVDGLTQIEKFATEELLTERGWETVSDGNFGEGFSALREKMKRIVDGARYIRENGKNVIIIAHSKVKPVDDPTQDAYDRVEFECGKDVINFITGNVDFCAYFRPLLRSVKASKNAIKGKAVGSGAKELIFEDAGAVLSKNRVNRNFKKVEFASSDNPSDLYKKFWNDFKNSTEEKNK